MPPPRLIQSGVTTWIWQNRVRVQVQLLSLQRKGMPVRLTSLACLALRKMSCLAIRYAVQYFRQYLTVGYAYAATFLILALACGLACTRCPTRHAAVSLVRNCHVVLAIPALGYKSLMDANIMSPACCSLSSVVTQDQNSAFIAKLLFTAVCVGHSECAVHIRFD